VLGSEGQQALGRFEEALLATWSRDDAVLAFGEALERMLPGERFVLYPGAVGGPPRWTVSNDLPAYRGELPVHRKLPEFRARLGSYGRTASDPFANRPVGLRDLARVIRPDGVEMVVEELLAPAHYYHQLRTVLYDLRRRVALFAGLYRPQGARPFDVLDHARLHAMQPALRRWVALAEALGFEPMGDGALVRGLEALDVPAFVADGDDIVFANASARAVHGFGGGGADAWRHRGAVVPLRTAHEGLELVLLPRALVTDAARAELPAYLRPVADLLRRGESDKEVAARLGIPLATARTYASRVLVKAGVRSRRDLIRGA
jgi:hypothetical protein